MRVLYEKLPASNHYRQLSVKEYLEDVGRGVVTARFGSNASTVTLHTSIDDLHLDAKIAFPLGAIVAELLTNSLKYAFEPYRYGTITMTLVPEDGRAVLRVHDDGRGFPDDFDHRTSDGFGLMLVRMMAEQINGDLSMTSSAGVCSIVTFPL